MADKKPEEKQFSLKPVEIKLIEALQQSYFSNLANTLSFIALERLAYPVSQNTRYRVEGNNIFIHEAIKEEKVATTAQPKKGK